MQLTTRCHNFNRQASLTQTQIQCKSMLALHTDNNTISHWWSINLCHRMISLSETDWFIIRTALTAQTVWAALVSFIPSDLQVRNWGDQNKAPVKTALSFNFQPWDRQKECLPPAKQHVCSSEKKHYYNILGKTLKKLPFADATSCWSLHNCNTSQILTVLLDSCSSQNHNTLKW